MNIKNAIDPPKSSKIKDHEPQRDHAQLCNFMQTDKSLLLDEKVSETSKKNNFNAFKINLIKKIQKE